MSYNNFYMRLRVKAVQEFDKMYYEPEYKAKCHKRVWERLGRYTFGISYQSYLDYLKMDVSDIPPTPFEARQAKRKLVDKLLERELERMKRPVRPGKNGGVEKRTCRTGVTPTFSAAGRAFGSAPFFRPAAFQLTGFPPSSPSCISVILSNTPAMRSPKDAITRSSQ